MESTKEIVIFDEGGLKVSVKERLCMDTYATAIGGWVAARLEPLSVVIEADNQPIRIIGVAEATVERETGADTETSS